MSAGFVLFVACGLAVIVAAGLLAIWIMFGREPERKFDYPHEHLSDDIVRGRCSPKMVRYLPDRFEPDPNPCSCSRCMNG